MKLKKVLKNMSQDDVIQIRVGNSPIGIIGFKADMEEWRRKITSGPMMMRARSC